MYIYSFAVHPAFKHTHQNKDDIAIDETDEDNQDSLQQLIDQNLAAIDEYSTRFHNISRLNTEIFRVIDTTLNPIQRTSVRAVQAAPQTSMPGGFKLNSDLRPNLLVKDCTLKEVNTFSESFYNYMKSSPNSIIPEGTLWAQINVNVDQHWLTEIKERKFTKENTLEEFLQVLETINILKFPIHQRRVTLLDAKQKGDPLEFVRELIELARSTEWGTHPNVVTSIDSI